MNMKNLSKKELEKMLLETVTIYKKLQFTNSHEYCMDNDATDKMFTVADKRRMDEIIKELHL